MAEPSPLPPICENPESHRKMLEDYPLQPGVKFGVFDTRDKLWLGDNKGPKLFVDEVIKGKHFPGSLRARMAAELFAIQLGWSPMRCKAMPYKEGPVRKRDEKKTRMTVLEALNRKERGLEL